MRINVYNHHSIDIWICKPQAIINKVDRNKYLCNSIGKIKTVNLQFYIILEVEMKLKQMAQELGVDAVIDNRRLELFFLAIFLLCSFVLLTYICINPHIESKETAGKELGRIDMADVFGNNPIVNVIAKAKAGKIKPDESFLEGYLSDSGLDRQYFLRFFSAINQCDLLKNEYNEWQLKIRDDAGSVNAHSIFLLSNFWKISLKIPLTLPGPGYHFPTFWSFSNKETIEKSEWRTLSMYNTYMVRNGTKFILINAGPSTGDIFTYTFLFVGCLIAVFLIFGSGYSYARKKKREKFIKKHGYEVMTNEANQIIKNLASGKEYIKTCKEKFKYIQYYSSLDPVFVLEKEMNAMKLFCCKTAKQEKISKSLI